MKKREPSFTAGDNVSCCSHYRKQFLKKLKVELPYYPAIPLLGIYPDKTYNSKRYMHPDVHSTVRELLTETTPLGQAQ